MSSVNFPSELWDSDVLEGLNAHERYLYIYLFTSPFCNSMGVFALSEKKMAYHTGMPLDELKTSLNGLAKKKSVYYKTGYVIMPLRIKFAALNTMRRKNVVSTFRLLPVMLIQDILKSNYQTFMRIDRKQNEKCYLMIFEALTGYKEEKKEPKSEKPEEYKYGDLVRKLIPLFPDKHQPKDKRGLIKWHDVARLLIEKDLYTEDQILAAVTWARNDEKLWKKALQTFPAIRNKMSNGGDKMDLFLEEINKSGETGRHINVPEKQNTNEF